MAGRWLRTPKTLAVVVLNLLLAGAIAHDLSGRVGKRLKNLNHPLASGTKVLPPIAASVTDNDDKAVAKGWNPFGRSQTNQGTATPPAPVSAPETQRNLTLLGIIHVDGRGVTARAFIRTPSTAEKGYRVGDHLPGNLQLAAIHPNRILLSHKGRFETLRLPREGGVTLGLGQQRENNPMVGQALRQLRQQILTNPAQVLAQVGIEPAFHSGRFQGYRLLKGNQPGFLAPFGLRPGDIITNVNNIPMDAPLRGMEALGSLATLTELHLQVRRGTSTKSFDYSINR